MKCIVNSYQHRIAMQTLELFNIQSPMATDRSFSSDFWLEDILEKLSTEEKLIYIYIRNNAHTTLCGLFKLPLRAIYEPLKVSEQAVKQTLKKLEKDGKIVYDNGLIFIRDFPESQNSDKVHYLAEHVRKYEKKLRKLDNLAYRAFYERFKETIENPVVKRSKKSASKSTESQKIEGSLPRASSLPIGYEYPTTGLLVGINSNSDSNSNLDSNLNSNSDLDSFKRDERGFLNSLRGKIITPNYSPKENSLSTRLLTKEEVELSKPIINETKERLYKDLKEWEASSQLKSSMPDRLHSLDHLAKQDSEEPESKEPSTILPVGRSNTQFHKYN